MRQNLLFLQTKLSYSSVVIALLLWGGVSIARAAETDEVHVHAGHDHHHMVTEESEGGHDHGKVIHAPAGIMGAHAHGAGGIMLGYMYMNMSMDGLQMGGDRIDYASVPAAYSMVPTEMTMEMHMFDLMYAPTDKLTLMAMPKYLESEMTMEMIRMGAMGGHGHGGTPMMVGDQSTHQLEGWGDTQMGAIYQFWKSGSHEVLGNLMISVPTGSVSRKNVDGTYMQYGMQLGSGTWDAIPAIIYKGSEGSISWGAKMAVTLRLEDENSSGYQLGNVTDLTAWAAWSPVSSLRLSTRLTYRDEGELSGHYNGAHNHSSPGDIQANYGGEVLSAGFGVNGILPLGSSGHHQVGAEVLVPLKEDLNGVQLGQDLTLILSWTSAF